VSNDAAGDTERLRYIAENPEVMRYLYDILNAPEARQWPSALYGMRVTVDFCAADDAAEEAR
jgi:hypothetical protein